MCVESAEKDVQSGDCFEKKWWWGEECEAELDTNLQPLATHRPAEDPKSPPFGLLNFKPPTSQP